MLAAGRFSQSGRQMEIGLYFDELGPYFWLENCEQQNLKFSKLPQHPQNEQVKEFFQKLGMKRALCQPVSNNPLATNQKPKPNQNPNHPNQMKNQHLTEKELEAAAGGIQGLFIGGDAGLVLDSSINDSFNTTTVTQVDASTDILGSFNQQSYMSYFGL